MKKLYSVSVEILLEMPVVAESPEEAEAIALNNWEDELGSGGSAFPIAVAQELKKPHGFWGSIPWGDQDGKTVEEYL